MYAKVLQHVQTHSGMSDLTTLIVWNRGDCVNHCYVCVIMILTLLISTVLAAAQVTEIAGEEDSGHRCEVEEEHTERQSSMHPLLPVDWRSNKG